MLAHIVFQAASNITSVYMHLSPCYSKELRRRPISVPPVSIRRFPLLSGALVGAGEGEEAQSAGGLV